MIYILRDARPPYHDRRPRALTGIPSPKPSQMPRTARAKLAGSRRFAHGARSRFKLHTTEERKKLLQTIDDDGGKMVCTTCALYIAVVFVVVFASLRLLLTPQTKTRGNISGLLRAGNALPSFPSPDI